MFSQQRQALLLFLTLKKQDNLNILLPNFTTFFKQNNQVFDGAINFVKSQTRWTNYVNRKKSTGKRYRYEIDNAKKHGFVLDPDGVTQFTIKAYHEVKRGERGGVYQVAVEFTDRTIRWADKKEIKKHSSASLQLYFDKLNQPNPEINPDGLQLS